MIKGIHGLFYSDQAEATRAFLRDKMGIPCIDVGDGWLIFRFDEADMGCHPTGPDAPEAGPDCPPSGTHEISFYCDDIEQTVAELKSRGVEFAAEIADQGWGYVTRLEMPGQVKALLYQPKYGKR